MNDKDRNSERDRRNERIYGGSQMAIAIVMFLIGVYSILLKGWPPDAASASLVLLGTIAFGLGAERLNRFIKLGDDIKGVQASVEKSIAATTELSLSLKDPHSFRILKGDDQIYAEGANLIKLAELRIRSTAIGQGPPNAPAALGQAYADKLLSSREQGRPVLLDNVIGVEAGKYVSQERKRRFDLRYELFKAAKVIGSVTFYAAPATVGVDFLIIDEVHMMISVPYGGKDYEGFKFGLLIFDSQEVVREFANWFDTVLLKRSTKVDSHDDLQVAPPASNTSASGP